MHVPLHPTPLFGGMAPTMGRVPEARVIPIDERSLVEQAKAGDREALGELCRRYGPVVFRSVLMPRLGSRARAEDALSETYARVIEKLVSYEWQPGGFYPWFRTVALRIALDALRREKRTVLWDAPDIERELNATEETERLDVRLLEARDQAIVRQRLEFALGQIHPRYSEAIRLRILQEQPRDVVASALSVTTSTFDVLLHRALKALRAALAEAKQTSDSSEDSNE